MYLHTQTDNSHNTHTDTQTHRRTNTHTHTHTYLWNIPVITDLCYRNSSYRTSTTQKRDICRLTVIVKIMKERVQGRSSATL